MNDFHDKRFDEGCPQDDPSFSWYSEVSSRESSYNKGITGCPSIAARRDNREHIHCFPFRGRHFGREL